MRHERAGHWARTPRRHPGYQGRTRTACHRSDSGRRESDSRQDGAVPIGFCRHFGCQCAYGPGMGTGAAEAFRSGGLPAAYCPKASRSIADLTGQLKRIAWIGRTALRSDGLNLAWCVPRPNPFGFSRQQQGDNYSKSLQKGQCTKLHGKGCGAHGGFLPLVGM